ncbi:MAG: hypothetical protein QG671_2739 [Actinomycetota bacterium]|nr:hypothetical protein [Actinomycetota bacterium]
MSRRLVVGVGEVVEVTAMAAAAFIVDDRGRRMSLGIVPAGLVVGLDIAPLQLELAPVAVGSVPWRHVASRGSTQEAEWFEHVVATVSQTGASAETGHRAVDAPAAAQALTSAFHSWRRAASAHAASTDQRDRAAAHAQADQIVAAVRNPGQPSPRDQQDSLGRALQRLGRLQGFEVGPIGPVPDSVDDPLGYTLRKAGLAYRPVTLTPGWQRRTRTPLLAWRPTGQTVEYVVLSPRRSGFSMQGPNDLSPQPLAGVGEPGSTAVEIASPLPGDVSDGRRLAQLAFTGSRSARLVVVACAGATAVLGLLTPYLTGVVLTAAQLGEADALLGTTAMVLLAAAFAATSFTIVQTLTVWRISQLAMRRVQSAVWQHLLTLPATFFREHTVGDLTTRVMATAQLQAAVSPSAVSAMMAAVFASVNLVVMYALSVPLAIGATAVLLASWVVVGFGARQSARFAEEINNSTREANAWLVQVLSAVSKIRLSGAERRFVAMAADRFRDQAATRSRAALSAGRTTTYQVVAGALVPALFMVIIAANWNSGRISAADYAAFSAAFGGAFVSLNALAVVSRSLATIVPTLRQLEPILAAAPERAEDAVPLLGELQGDLEFRHVWFRYTDDAPWVLRDVSFHIPAGSFTAFVGYSGGGKSTVLRLLLGMETPTQGQVLVDGQDLATVDLVDFRERCGAVLQGSAINHGSILDNIRAGSLTPVAAVWAAAEAAAMADDIRAMPMGMNTVIDPATISGGEQQRLLLARAIARKPGVLFLDEATSALDNVTQSRVATALGALGCTRIAVAHRFSTIHEADRILLLRVGEIASSGTFAELTATDEYFARMAARQLA